MTLEQEQLEDLSWADRVLSGHGDSLDTTAAARGVLEVMVSHGATHVIRQKAIVLLFGRIEAAA